jgi:vacuolar-type H+-ATPase subunit F/Vma7
MSHRIRVLTRPGVAAGFSLAGIRSILAGSGLEATTKLVALEHDPTVGVVLIEQHLYDSLPAATIEAIGRRELPLVVPFPGPTREAAETPEAYVIELLRRAIGYRVRLV